eukprot:gnl/MRDRNA2_/MRDRNA2_90906_c0_seq1.p1 gnl/MRDRNA2_/MRDRNA2_90906_c0~~gnl/MRDRNA2_/MRDRNA2_90906_c0_seq1.p1  ORF type:complete len:340 (+),score=63.96 gnl/MRDRNA2_/MRDRNA2_90906_c0_seq1:96-1115(+)
MPLGNAHLQLLRLSRTKPNPRVPGLRKNLDESTGSAVSTPSRFSSKESTGSHIEGLQDKLHELQSLYDEKCSQLQDRKHELEAARTEVEELKLLMKTQSAPPSSVVPAKLAAGLGAAGGDPRAEELQRLFSWLADHVVLEEPMEFNAAFDLVTGEQHVHFRNIVQWRLRQSELRLTVPEELGAEIGNLLLAAKRDPNTMCEARAKTIIDSWSLTMSEAVSGTLSRVTLLTHRDTGYSCLVANFPLPPQMEASSHVSIGDSVEVYFEGQWFKGTVTSIEDGDMTYVHCDVDPPDLITKASVHMLRRPIHRTPEVESNIVPQNPAPSPEEDIKTPTHTRQA